MTPFIRLWHWAEFYVRSQLELRPCAFLCFGGVAFLRKLEGRGSDYVGWIRSKNEKILQTHARAKYTNTSQKSAASAQEDKKWLSLCQSRIKTMRHTLPQQLHGGIHFCFSVFVCVIAVCNLLVVFMGFSQAERSESLCVSATCGTETQWIQCCSISKSCFWLLDIISADSGHFLAAKNAAG